jgi:hypothetical protein
MERRATHATRHLLVSARPPSRDMMRQVRETNGELTVWWPDKDQSVATLKASWRGPIPPSTGPRSR